MLFGHGKGTMEIPVYDHDDNKTCASLLVNYGNQIAQMAVDANLIQRLTSVIDLLISLLPSFLSQAPSSRGVVFATTHCT